MKQTRLLKLQSDFLHKARHAVWYAALLILSGCVPRCRTRVLKPTLLAKKGELRMCEAKWSDVPLPLGITPDTQKTREALDGAGCIFAYTTPLLPDECLSFYKREMERLGWREELILSFNNPVEYIVSYEKPTQLATLMIDTVQGKTRVRLHSGFKKSNVRERTYSAT